MDDNSSMHAFALIFDTTLVLILKLHVNYTHTRTESPAISGSIIWVHAYTLKSYMIIHITTLKLPFRSQLVNFLNKYF